MRAHAVPGTLLLLLASFLAIPPAAAQDADEEGARAGRGAETPVATAPVTLDGRELFALRGVAAFPAERRAADVAGRIRELARDPAFDPAALRLADDPRVTRVLAGELQVVRVFDAVDVAVGVDRRVLAEVFQARIRDAILDYRAARTPEALRASAWHAGIATVVAAAACLLLLRLAGALRRAFERRYRERVQAVTISSFEVVRAERLWGVVRAVARGVTVVALLAVAYLYLRYLLGQLPWTRGTAAQIDGWVLAPLGVLGRGLVEKVPDLIFLAVLYVLVRALLRLVHLFFAAVGRGEVELSGFDPEWADPTYKLVRVGIVAFGLVVAYPYIPGSSSAAFKGVSLFLGVVFSLGSSSTISNIIAGYTMTYRRAFREGDRVKVADVMGDVTKVRLQVTHLRTPKNEEVVIPNSMILANEVVNFSTLARTEGLVLHTTVGIGYETPWRQVEAMLLEAARRTPGALAEPAPFVRQLSLGDFAVVYELNVHVEEPRRMGAIYTDLHRNILDLFNEYGVQIMTPAYEGDPERPKVVPREQWHLPPAAEP